MIHKRAIQFFNWVFPHPSQGERAKFTMPSHQVGDEFEIWVDVPDLPKEGLKDLHLLIYTDANLPTSRRLNPIVKELTEQGLLPPTLLVGIAHHDSLLWKRNRDYVYGRKLRDGEWKGKRGNLGQAQAMYQFIAEELIPTLEERYSITGNRTFMGHSLAGSFALYCMLQPEPAFQNYLALSPAVWIYRRNLFKIARHFLAQGGELTGNVYFSAGSMEAFNMVLFSAKAYHKFLNEKDTDQLKTNMDVFPWRNHFNGVKPGIRKGLQWLAEREAFETIQKPLDEAQSEFNPDTPQEKLMSLVGDNAPQESEGEKGNDEESVFRAVS